MSDLVKLHSVSNAFTQGGNRLCFSHPEDSSKCIKVVRPDRTPELRRKQKKFPKNLKPLSRFDENRNELLEVERIERVIGEEAFELIPRYFGMIATDLGEGLCSEMIRDYDGKVSISIKQYLWVNGFSESLEKAFGSFSISWAALGMPSRDLLLHNIVVQKVLDSQRNLVIYRLVVIDGLGWSGLPLLTYALKPLAKYRAQKKIKKLEMAINKLISNKESGSDWGYHGWLNEEQRVSGNNNDSK